MNLTQRMRQPARRMLSTPATPLRIGQGTLSRIARVLTAGLLLAACSKGGKSGAAPVASLGVSFASEQAYRPLIRRWIGATAEERRALDLELAKLAKKDDSDPLAVLADVLRGWDALERGERGRAVELAKPALDGPPGSTHDLATLVVGAAARRSLRSRQALALLVPLLHKMLDPFATSFLNEELVRAAVGAGSWQDALRLMDVWLYESAPGERAPVRDKIARLLGDVPEAELLADARRRMIASHGAADAPELSQEGRRLAEVIAQHLARVAVAARNVPLARVLLAELGPWLGAEGEEVARLAADVARGRVTAKTVGVLLALGSTPLERRSADVLAGMAFGLGIGDSDARLVARDDGGKPEGVAQALTELAAEGAAVIVAGIDPRHGATAVAFAEAQGLPVVLLTPDPALSQRVATDVFLLGQDPARSVGVLAAALRDGGAKVVAGLGAPLAEERRGGRLGVGLELDCAPLPPLESLRAERVDAVVLLDGASCGDGVIELAERLRAPLGVGLGALAGIHLPIGTRVLAAGIFPLSEGDPDPRLAGWLESGRPPPSWWMALGRDAAVLAASAVHNLADAAGETEVRARRVEATAALGAAESDLWTSDERGFDDSRTLPRTITVSASGPAPAAKPRPKRSP